MSEFNIHPQHLNYTNESSNSTYTTLRSPYQLSNKGHTAYANETSNSTYSTLSKSGYQYILATALVCSAVESQLIVDSATVINRQTVTETFYAIDIGDTRPVRDRENSNFLDSATVINRQTVTELFLASDAATGKSFASGIDSAFIQEQVSTKTIQTLKEPVPIKEQVSTIIRQTAAYTTYIEGLLRRTIPYTTLMVAAQRASKIYTTHIAGAVNQLAGITATGSGPLGDANPIGPNVSVNGTILIGTVPPGAANTPVYIDLPATATYVTIGNQLNWGELYSYAMSLDYSGGSFAIASVPFIGAQGTAMKLFGLDAYITDSGKRYSNAMKGFTTSGIFGQPLLNKQFNLIRGASTALQNLNYSSGLNYVNPNVPQTNVLSLRQVAFTIAHICGINLTWIPSTPYDDRITDFSYEPTMNGFSTLNSIASRVGANLRWFGNNNYYIADPAFSVGLFSVPREQLISAGGIEEAAHYDLETGVGGAVPMNSFGTPVQSFFSFNRPSFPFALGQQGTYNLPTNSQNPQIANSYATPLIPVASLTKQLTQNDPPMVHSLPQNYDEVMIQILVPASYDVGTTAYMTTDPTFYDVFVAPGPNGSVGTLTAFGFHANQYIYTTYEGGAYVPKIKIDYRVFPNHPAITAGNFIMNIACTTKPIANSANNATVIPPTWVQTYRGNINCVFFGVLPLPGMWATATVDDLTVQGVIERVSFTPPGFLQLEVAQYARINWVLPPPQVTA